VRVLPAAPTLPGPRPAAPPRNAQAPALQAAAREIVGQLEAPAQRAAAIIGWVHDQMTYEITPAQIDDITLLARKRGDCTEYSQLAVTLLQAAGIPARMRSGFLIAGQSLVAHAWLEFHDGRVWQEADPTAGRTSVDAGYVDASVLEVIALLSLGQIEITSIEASP
jgi:transglutaminase-like putative cysteine protease